MCTLKSFYINKIIVHVLKLYYFLMMDLTDMSQFIKINVSYVCIML